MRLGVFRCPECGAMAGLDDCFLVMVAPHEMGLNLAELLYDGGVIHPTAGEVGVA